MELERRRYQYFNILLALMMPCLAMAQPTNFIHLQSENSKSFTVIFNGNSYASSETGYLLIPKVTSGDVQFEVTFPSTPSERFRFSCKMQDKPRGFTLKQGLDNGWSLFDMVSFDEMKAQKIEDLTKKQEVTEPMIPEISSKPVLPDAAKNNVALAASAVSSVAVIPIITKPKVQNVISDVSIQKIFDKTGSSGIDQVYIIHENGKSDTIALFIPTLKLSEAKQTASLKYELEHGMITVNNPLKVWGRFQYIAIKNQ